MCSRYKKKKDENPKKTELELDTMRTLFLQKNSPFVEEVGVGERREREGERGLD